jgi:hypothetical protein
MLTVGDTVGNSATIAGSAFGVDVAGSHPPIVSAATSQAGGVISGGQTGALIASGVATISNYRTVTSDSATLDAGIELVGGGGVPNAGTVAVTGSTSIAVLMLPGAANRVIIDAGAVFSGAVEGGNTIGAAVASTLELVPGAPAGTLAGIGGTIANFVTITFDPGAKWDLSGVLACFADTVADFASGDIIHLTNVVANSGSYASGELHPPAPLRPSIYRCAPARGTRNRAFLHRRAVCRANWHRRTARIHHTPVARRQRVACVIISRTADERCRRTYVVSVVALPATVRSVVRRAVLPSRARSRSGCRARQRPENRVRP